MKTAIEVLAEIKDQLYPKVKVLIIEVTDTKILVNGEKYSKRYKGMDIGDQILPILGFRLGRFESYKILVNGKNETRAFKSQVKAKYAGIPNKDYQKQMYGYALIK